MTAVSRTPSLAGPPSVTSHTRLQTTGDCRPKPHGWRLIPAAALLVTATIGAAPGAALTGASRLAAVYEAILSAQFERVDTELASACPPAPTQACEALRAEAVWWQILVEPDDRTRDSQLSALAATAITSSASWVEREPDQAEAWFYLAGSHTPLVQLRVLRGERLSAARDGRKIKDALERTLQLNPDLADAHLGIGLYHYYADVAPLYAKFLRWLFMLPGGDRVKGLQEILLARERGVLLAGEADFQLQQIYLWYENRARDALALLESLDARYPTNPVFLQRIAEVDDVYFHDLDASIGAWERLRDRAREHHVFASTTIATRAEKKLQQLIAARVKK